MALVTEVDGIVLSLCKNQLLNMEGIRIMKIIIIINRFV